MPSVAAQPVLGAGQLLEIGARVACPLEAGLVIVDLPVAAHELSEIGALVRLVIIGDRQKIDVRRM